MAIPQIIFNIGEGGLGRPLAGRDHVSGLLSFIADANLPSGFTTSDRIKKVFSVAEAEALGITKGDANSGVLWYHINEYFAIQPQGELLIGIYDDTTPDLTSIILMQNFANGEIRQFGIFSTESLSTGDIDIIQGALDTLTTNEHPAIALYACDISGVSDLTALGDLKALTNKEVSVVIGEDGNADGAALAVSTGASVTQLGAALGAVSLSNVNESILWRAKFNIVNVLENDVPAIANGDLVKDLSSGLINSLNDKGYIFGVKQTGLDGTFFNDSPTSIADSSDFAKIENNRTMQKAVRQIRITMGPNVGSPVFVNSDGTLTEGTIAVFENDTARALEQMLVDQEINAYEVTVNPAQDVITTGKVVITVQIVPVGVTRTIEFNIGFTPNIA